ncbi:hypothetical protein GIB67_028544 [Kingdonia uniflora]|uniref:Uncharacterized protein n=1 Tax=Kingdonia uniflora TaxID=39325 RepID=A0A7J7KVX8_9MAGN|nr:hypothetical protein GIB67_028544 [Kingdonia uniflora]
MISMETTMRELLKLVQALDAPKQPSSDRDRSIVLQTIDFDLPTCVSLGYNNMVFVVFSPIKQYTLEGDVVPHPLGIFACCGKFCGHLRDYVERIKAIVARNPYRIVHVDHDPVAQVCGPDKNDSVRGFGGSVSQSFLLPVKERDIEHESNTQSSLPEQIATQGRIITDLNMQFVEQGKIILDMKAIMIPRGSNPENATSIHR